MNKNSKMLVGIIVLVFPLFILGGLWAKTAMDRNADDNIWRVKITGYDPRDILYGHYLRFRYDWNFSSEQSVRNADCLCLNGIEDSNVNPTALPMQCSVADERSCSAVVKVRKSGGRYGFARKGEPEKYFIPEENANEVDGLFRQGETQFYIELAVRPNRSAAVHGLYVENEPLEDYLRRRPFLEEESVDD